MDLLILQEHDYAVLINYCQGQLPYEACGLLAGKVTDDQKRVVKIYWLDNIDHSPEHFSMDPREQFAALKDMRAHGLVLLGNFHSHPSTPARPSAEDIRLAIEPDKSYLILSLAQDIPVLKSFRVIDRQIIYEQLIIEGEQSWKQ